ncbi:MAG: VOC family protein [Rhodopila sp.]|jgi:predicted 3-demethylubiquinone-9 3-methyltransferase (glyoxalase superfamily)
MPAITPFLWFDGKVEEAMDFYLSIFQNAKVVDVTRYTEAGPGKPGTVMTATFELEGQRFIALNGGPQFPFTPAISMFVACTAQQEVDELWDRLSAGGELQQCGWLKDRYGLSWQIVPAVLLEMLQDTDTARASRVMRAMMSMIKIDIARLQQAQQQ